MPDIQDKEDVIRLVDAFYGEVRKDLIIGPVFAAAVKEGAWPYHLDRMYSFWNTVLFGKADYRGQPFSKHADLPIEEKHFQQWISLFCQTVDKLYRGSKADEAKMRAEKMGAMFLSKLTYLREHPNHRSIL